MRAVILLSFGLTSGCAKTQQRVALLEQVVSEQAQAQAAFMQESAAELERLQGLIDSLENGQAKPLGTDPAEAAENLLTQAEQAYDDQDFDTAKALRAELEAKYPGSRAAKASERWASELKIIGLPQTELVVEQWYQGSAKDLQGNKATLYIFWEVWCPHCKREVPKLSETYNAFKDQGLGIVGFTRQTSAITDDEVRGFIEDYGVNYPIAQEKGDNLTQYYGVLGIPAAATIVDGVVVWRGHPARITDELIGSWLGQ